MKIRIIYKTVPDRSIAVRDGCCMYAVYQFCANPICLRGIYPLEENQLAL